MALSDSNEIFKWGEFYKDLRQKKGGNESEGGPGPGKKKAQNIAEEDSSEDSSESSDSSSGEGSSSDEEEKSRLKNMAQRDDVFEIEQFPGGQQSNNMRRMQQISVGLNHAASIGLMDRQLYSWGYNDCLQLGQSED